MRNLGLSNVSRGWRVFCKDTPGEPIAGEFGTIYAPPHTSSRLMHYAPRESNG